MINSKLFKTQQSLNWQLIYNEFMAQLLIDQLVIFDLNPGCTSVWSQNFHRARSLVVLQANLIIHSYISNVF